MSQGLMTASSSVEGGRSDERELVERLRAGDQQAYTNLVHALAGQMLAVARRFLRDEQDCADAVQEAFVSAFQAIDSFDARSKLSTWLQRIVVNSCLMKLRSAARRATVSIDALLPQFDGSGHYACGVRPWDQTVLDQMCRTELRQIVRRCIDRLPESHRTVLLLRDIQELDTEETARVLQTTPGAVKVRLHRARQALRGLLDPILAGS